MVETRFPIPRPIVVRAIQVVSDPNAENKLVAEVVGSDPVLAVNLLRAANSARYAFRTKITQVSRAVNLMGQKAVRNLVLYLAVKDLIPADSLGDFPLSRFWEASVARGSAARTLAQLLRHKPSAQEDCFTVGLCQDLGVLVKLLKDCKLASRFAAGLDLPNSVRLYIEQQVGRGHNDITAELLGRWGLPSELTMPMRFHHWPDGAPEEYQPFAQIAHTAEAIADLFVVKDKRLGLEVAHRELAKLSDEENALQDIVTHTRELLEQTADMLQLHVEDQPSYEEIVSAANEALVDLHRSGQKLAKELQASLSEKEELIKKLNELNAQLENKAVTDALTGLPNRGAFDQALKQTLAQASRQEKCLSLLLIDIDFFKRFNDEHGHNAGDETLRTVAQAIAGAVRTADLAARYGGEEFAAILPFTDQTGAKIVAERIRQAVSEAEVTWEGINLKVTVSVGGVTVCPGAYPIPPPSCEITVAAADKALYRAKAEGRNCVCWNEEGMVS